MSGGKTIDMLATTRANTVVCQMIHPGHPDDPHGEKPCTNLATGITEDNVLVCRGCGEQMIREEFAVFPLPVKE